MNKVAIIMLSNKTQKVFACEGEENCNQAVMLHMLKLDVNNFYYNKETVELGRSLREGNLPSGFKDVSDVKNVPLNADQIVVFGYYE